VHTTAAERAEFRDGIRKFLTSRLPETAVRSVADGEPGVAVDVWAELADQFGLAGLAIAEDAGGGGLGTAEVLVAVEETARALAPVPLLSSAIAGYALTQAALTQAALPGAGAGAHELLGRLAEATVMSVAGIDGTPSAVEVTGSTMSGTLTLVDAQIATTALVPVSGSGPVALYAVDLAGAGVTVEELDVLDRTRRQFRIILDAAPADLICADFSAGADRTLAYGALLASAELFAVAERSLEIATAYAQDRQQFGRSIGAFQSIKHLLADALATVEQMRAGVEQAGTLVDDFSDADLAELAAVLKSYCSDHAPQVVQTLIQVLGGIGFTWEHPAHLYLRRARSVEQMFGDGVAQRARLAAAFGL
jgi:alkylation response protein AidB-like acyl-CoA dehydrogenase